mmetsp:Transcript_30892/g.67661  ORF Transcript_30892/g.67661 Transcript_30892/m.67661 type:complete len:320 (+) Transcript_30892:714-1673(+)
MAVENHAEHRDRDAGNVVVKLLRVARLCWEHNVAADEHEASLGMADDLERDRARPADEAEGAPVDRQRQKAREEHEPHSVGLGLASRVRPEEKLRRRVAAFRRRVHADALEEHRSEQRLRRLPKGDRVLQLRARDGILLLLGALPDLEHGGGEHGEQAEEEADGPQLDVAHRGDAHAKQQDEERQLHLVGRAHVVVKIVDRQRHRHDGQLSHLVKADAIQRERHIHEADGADARQGNLELLELRQVRPGRLEESTRPQQLVEDDGEAKVEEAQRDGEVEACGENLLVDEDNGHRRRHIAKRVAGGDQRVRHVRLAVGSG